MVAVVEKEGDEVAPESSDERRQSTLPPMDFSTFLLSLASSAQVNLGLVPTPDGDTLPVNLVGAKQIIDILAVLEEKTRGNLDEAEMQLISSLIYDLRIQYCDAEKETAHQ